MARPGLSDDRWGHEPNFTNGRAAPTQNGLKKLGMSGRMVRCRFIRHPIALKVRFWGNEGTGMPFDEGRASTAASQALSDMLDMPWPWAASDVSRVLGRLCHAYGFTHGALSVFQGTETGQGELRAVASNWSDPFRDGFERLGLGRYSPVMRALKADPSPFVWDIESLFGYTPGGGEPADETVSFLLSCGHVHGLFLPVHGPGGLQGAGVFGGTHPISDIAARTELHCLTFTLFGILSACRLEENRSNNPLSHREMDCLRLAMLGKTSSEIGQSLGVSEHTVSQHLASATRKMNAANRTHAVAMAAQLGYLS